MNDDFHILKSREVEVNGKKHTWWSLDHKIDLRRYLSGIDPEIITYKHSLYSLSDMEQSVVALRQLQHEALEFLFAIICAYKQSPLDIPAWMSLYTNSDLRESASLVMNQKNKISNINLISSLANFAKDRISIKGSRVGVDRFSQVLYKHLEGLYANFSNSYSIDEYNSIKHSYRVSSGEAELLIDFGGGKFTSVINGETSIGYYSKRKIESYGGRRDFYIEYGTRTYNLANINASLDIIYLSR